MTRAFTYGSIHQRVIIGSLIVLGILIFMPQTAHAAGSAMPWEGPLTNILRSIEGPVAKIFGTIAIIMTGIGLAFGDAGGGMRNLIKIVFGLSIAFTATSFFLSFFSFTGGAVI